jgi:hypothetical protein
VQLATKLHDENKTFAQYFYETEKK